MNGPTLQSIRQRARIAIAAAGGMYAKRLSDEIDGHRNVKRWTRGVIVREPDVMSEAGAIATVVARSPHPDGQRAELARAVGALRAAGWTVTDGGDVLALPKSAKGERA